MVPEPVVDKSRLLGSHSFLGNNLQHAWFRRLRSDKEPEGGGKVEPSVGHKIRIVKEDTGVSKHCQGEGSIVVVP